MTEFEILDIVEKIRTIANSSVIETTDLRLHSDQIKHSFTISNNEIEKGFIFHHLIDSMESGAIIIALLKEENITHILNEYKEYSSSEREVLYLHYLVRK